MCLLPVLRNVHVATFNVFISLIELEPGISRASPDVVLGLGMCNRVRCDDAGWIHMMVGSSKNTWFVQNPRADLLAALI